MSTTTQELELVAPLPAVARNPFGPLATLARRRLQPRGHPARMIAPAQDGPLTLAPILSSPAADRSHCVRGDLNG